MHLSGGRGTGGLLGDGSRSLALDRAFALIILLFLFLPLENQSSFSGIPLTGAAEVALLTLVLCTALIGARRTIVPNLTTQLRAVAVGLACAGLLLRLALLLGEPSGFAACFRSTLEPPPHSQCERSFDAPLGGSDVTRHERNLDIGPIDGPASKLVAPGHRTLVLEEGIDSSDWRLDFVNSNRFYLYQPGEIDRRLFPFVANFSGRVAARAGELVRVNYVGEGWIDLGDGRIPLEPSYEAPSTVELQAPTVDPSIASEFAYNEQHVLAEGPAPPLSPYARFELTDNAGEPLSSARPSWELILGSTLGMAGLALCAVLAISIMSVLIPLRKESAAVVALLAGTAVLHVSGVGGVADAFVKVSPVVVMLLLWRRIGEVRLRTLLTAGLLACLGIAGLRAGIAGADADAVLYGVSGHDFTTYESFAHEILASGSLQGGEDLFYFQPGYRYIAFLEHLVFGAGGVLPSVFALAALNLAAYLVIFRFVTKRNHIQIWTIAGLSAGTLILLIVNSEMVTSFVHLGLSEYPTWAFLLAGFTLLMAGHPSRFSWCWGAACIGAATVIRPNQLPAVLFLWMVFIWIRGRKHGRHALVATVCLMVVAFLPLAHNLYYGHEFRFLPPADQQEVNVPLPPTKIFDAFSDEQIGAVLRDQLSHVLYLVPTPQEEALGYYVTSRLLSVGIRGAQFLWLAMLGVVAWLAFKRRAKWFLLGVLGLPLAYLLPHVFYQVHVYYPRHIIAGYVAMTLSVLYVTGKVAIARE